MTRVPSVRELLDFRERVVLVTGASRGIGRGIALRFAEAGASVAVHHHTGEGEARELAALLARTGAGPAAVFRADLTVRGDVEQLAGEVHERFGGIDVLVNNAGIYPLHPLMEMSESDWDQVVDANLKSTFLVTQAVARTMIARKRGGAIVNISSIEAIDPAPLHSHYSAAKGGTFMFTRAAALELSPAGIRVNAVAPGLIHKAGLDEEWPDGVERYKKRAPLGRLGEPSDVADACLFLASPAARWITGVQLVVDGGVTSTQSF